MALSTAWVVTQGLEHGGPEVLSELMVCRRMALPSWVRAMTTRLFWKGWRSLLSSAILQRRVPGQRQKEKEQAQPDSTDETLVGDRTCVFCVEEQLNKIKT